MDASYLPRNAARRVPIGLADSMDVPRVSLLATLHLLGAAAFSIGYLIAGASLLSPLLVILRRRRLLSPFDVASLFFPALAWSLVAQMQTSDGISIGWGNFLIELVILLVFTGGLFGLRLRCRELPTMGPLQPGVTFVMCCAAAAALRMLVPTLYVD